MSDDSAISNYFAAKDIVHMLFGYKPDWVEIPMEDKRGLHWMLTNGEGSGSYLVYSPEPLTVESVSAGATIYGGPIYTQRFLPKWVYRSIHGGHVMVSVDTRTDGNKFLMILDADKECTDDKVRAAYGKWERM